MLRLLAKLPEPGVLMEPEGYDVEEIDEARATYVEWTNRILDDQLDVARVVFTDREGRHRFWLERDPMSLVLRPPLVPPPTLPQEYLDAGLSAQPRSVIEYRYGRPRIHHGGRGRDGKSLRQDTLGS